MKYDTQGEGRRCPGGFFFFFFEGKHTTMKLNFTAGKVGGGGRSEILISAWNLSEIILKTLWVFTVTLAGSDQTRSVNPLFYWTQRVFVRQSSLLYMRQHVKSQYERA